MTQMKVAFGQGSPVSATLIAKNTYWGIAGTPPAGFSKRLKTPHAHCWDVNVDEWVHEKWDEQLMKITPELDT